MSCEREREKEKPNQEFRNPVKPPDCKYSQIQQSITSHGKSKYEIKKP